MSEQTSTELEQLFREAPSDDGHAEGTEGDEHALKKRRRRGSTEKAISGLNLTAMMDMFTIILVFLLKNYASQPENITLSDELTPPKSTAKVPMDVALVITVTTKGILVDDKLVVQLTPEGRIVGEEEGKASGAISALNETLTTKVADMKAMEARGGTPFDGKLMVVADRSVPYALLMRVLYTAGINQFSQYKLVVRSAGEGGGGDAAASAHH